MLTNLLAANRDDKDTSSLADVVAKVLYIGAVLYNLAFGDRLYENLALHHLTTLVFGLARGLSF